MKRNIIVLAIIALIFSGCRKEADYHPYIGENSALAYETCSGQFDYIWKCISTGYVFWDVDDTNWDAVYEEYMPKFEALDAKHDAGETIEASEIEALYKGAMGGLRDHHMNVMVKNPFSPSDEVVRIRPGLIETQTRDYYVEDIPSSRRRLAELLSGLSGLDSAYEIESAEMVADDPLYYFYCLIKLPDGRKIPYLWQSQAQMSLYINYLGEPDQPGAIAALIDRWFSTIQNTPREELAGIILDNRCNGGGRVPDFDYVVGSFINTPTEILKSRCKEGPGRLEHSAWTPMIIDPLDSYHRDITAENIPFVVLTDLYSISMGEMEAMAIKNTLPTSYLIGERTFGATGPLVPGAIDLTYGGPFGDINSMEHFVYTATFETMIDGQVMEGIGFTPDKVVNRKDYNGDFRPQIDAAIEYIQNAH